MFLSRKVLNVKIRGWVSVDLHIKSSFLGLSRSPPGFWRLSDWNKPACHSSIVQKMAHTRLKTFNPPTASAARAIHESFRSHFKYKWGIDDLIVCKAAQLVCHLMNRWYIVATLNGLNLKRATCSAPSEAFCSLFSILKYRILHTKIRGGRRLRVKVV